jgi:DNA primase
MTGSTPPEIEALFELAKPVSAARRAPPRQGRPQPVGLELQILRHLVAHPPLSLTLDESALQCFAFFGPESAERLRQLVAAAQALGEHGGFAALAQQLKETSVEYDGLIAEIAAEPESDFDSVKLWLAGAVRQIKKDTLKQELDQLFSSGLTSDQMGIRYREITAIQNQLALEDEADRTPR